MGPAGFFKRYSRGAGTVEIGSPVEQEDLCGICQCGFKIFEYNDYQ